jgi:PAS domain S-box-containing protein
VIDHLRRRDRSDGTLEIVGYLQEVTAERATERKLQQAHEELDAMTSAGPGLLYRARTDATGGRQILSIADNVERITGFSMAEILQPSWFIEHSEAPARQELAAALGALGPNDTATLEFRLVDRTGHWRWLRDSVRVVSRTGDTAELVGYWTDITSEKELANQLAQAGKLALLGELATGMAHELRQPLATINFASENAIMALQQSPSDIPEALAKLERVIHQVNRSTELIDHLQIFGRRQDAALGQVDLAEAVDGASMIMAGRFGKASVDLLCDIPDELPAVLGQSIPIEQVLINLFSNACDAYMNATSLTSDAPRTIEVTAEQRGDTVLVTVADHAGGIPEAIIDRVFEPFFTTKPPSKGTGLGLSISASLARDQGGALSVRNAGDGARFELRLKVSDSGVSNAQAPTADIPKPAAAVAPR